MDLLLWIAVVVAIPGLVFVLVSLISSAASEAYFRAKLRYQRKLLSNLAKEDTRG